MPEVQRFAEATWHGSLREGKGQLTTESGVLDKTPYSFMSRFESGTGTNPEELIASAHAGCYSMALASSLSKKEYYVHHINTRATVYLTPQATGGSLITKILLTVRGKVDEISQESFLTAAEETRRTCIVSQALASVPMELDAKLD